MFSQMLSCRAMNHLEMLADPLDDGLLCLYSARQWQRFHCLVWSFSHWIFQRATFSASKQTYNPVKTNKGDKRYGSESLNHPTLEVRVYRGISFVEQKNLRMQYISRASCHAQCSMASWYLSIKQESHKEFLSSSI